MLESTAPLFHSAKFTDPQQVLESIFGFREFRPGQRRIRRERHRDFEGWQMVLHGRVGNSDIHSVLSRSDAGEER